MYALVLTHSLGLHVGLQPARSARSVDSLYAVDAVSLAFSAGSSRTRWSFRPRRSIMLHRTWGLGP